MSSTARKLDQNHAAAVDEAIVKVHKRADGARKQKIIISVVMSIVLIVVSSLSYFWWIYSSSHVSTDNAYIESKVYALNSHVMGYIKTVLVEENQAVKKGQSLIELDDDDLKIELEYKTARYQKAQADLKRLTKLNQEKVVSQSDLEAAETLTTSLRADRDGTLLKMKFTKVVSPADGIISKQGVNPGQFVQPGQSLMMIVSNEKFWVRANFKETQLARVRKGMPVEAIVDAYPGVKIKGRVEGIYPSSGAAMSLIPPENATGNFTKIVQRIPVRISLDPSPDIELRSGMSVVPTILIK